MATTVNGIRIKNKNEDAYNNYFNNYDTSINSFTTSTGEVINNPYALTEAERQYYAMYQAGVNPWRDSQSQLLSDAYNKQNQAAQWYAQMQTSYENREYNDYSSQVERQQEAGLNPDLNGVDASSAAGTAPEVAAPNSVPALPGAQDQIMNLVGDVFGMLGNFGNAAVSFLNTGYGLQQTIQSIRNARAEYSANLLSKSLPSLMQYLPDEAFNKGANLMDYFTEDFVTGSGFSNEDYREMSSFLKSANLPQSSRADFQEYLTRATMSRQARTAAAMSPLAPSFVNDTYKSFIQYDAQLKFYQQAAAAAQARYQEQYTNSLSPDIAADAFNSQNQQTINNEALQEYEMQRTLAQLLPDVFMLTRAYQYINSGNELQQAFGYSLYNTVTGKNSSMFGAAYSALSALTGTPSGDVVNASSAAYSEMVSRLASLIFGTDDPNSAGRGLVENFQEFSDYVLNPQGNSKGKGIAKSLWEALKAPFVGNMPDNGTIPNMLDSMDNLR